MGPYVSLLVLNVSSLVFMRSYASLWILMGLNKSIFVFMDAIGSFGVHICIFRLYVSLWVGMCPYGSLCVLLGPYASLWVLTGPYASV